MISMHLADERFQPTAAIHSLKSVGWLRGLIIFAPLTPLL
jgi:hypothetical protein